MVLNQDVPNSWRAPGARASGSSRFPLVGWAVLVCLVCSTSGCAIHYRNAKTGSEHLWGLGQMRMETNSGSPATQWASVTTGTRVPGLCLSVGPDHFGLSLGYRERQQMNLVSPEQVSQLEIPQRAWPKVTCSPINGRWTLGHARMRGPGSPRRHWTIVTGRACAGLGLAAGGGETGLQLGLASGRTAALQNTNVQVELDQKPSRWPGFDLFATEVRVAAEANPAEQPMTINPEEKKP